MKKIKKGGSIQYFLQENWKMLLLALVVLYMLGFI